MKLLTLAEQRRRFDNLTFAYGAVKDCLFKHQVHDYIPGHAIYNFGEYPRPVSAAPTEFDEQRLAELASIGVGLIHIHEDWNDAIRVGGADKYTSTDPKGLAAFIELCHKNGIKVLPYFSTGFFDVRDPDMREEFYHPKRPTLFSRHFTFTGCDPKSPEWTTFVLEKMKGILDNHDWDGIYNDMGYPDDANFIDGYIQNDPYIEDTMARIYSAVKERGGIVKVHQGACIAPRANTKIYDYLIVGESVADPAELRRSATFQPYITPLTDFWFYKGEPDEVFARTIPFMQFENRYDGRPFTGERITVPGIDYTFNKIDNRMDMYVASKKWYDEHPDGPYTYSEWSSVPDDVAHRDKWASYMALYRPMVEENSHVLADITDSTLLLGKKPDSIVMSLFVNSECYLVVSNVGEKPQKVTLAEEWIDRESGKPVRELTLGKCELSFLVKPQ